MAVGPSTAPQTAEKRVFRQSAKRHCGKQAAGLTFAALYPVQRMRCISSGEVSERFKEHAWKVCVRQNRTEGSNPSLSATFKRRGFYLSLLKVAQCLAFEPGG